MRSLQDIVDALSARLDVPVTLEDARMRLLVHSTHSEEVDRYRQGLILTRRAPDWVEGWAREHGLYDTDGPVRLPGDPALELQARVAAPIRWQGQLLGWIFLLDARQDLDEEGLQVASEAAADAAVILSRSHRAEQQRRQQRGAILGRLLDEDATDRTRAARAAVHDAVLVEGPVRVLVADVGDSDRQIATATEDALLKVAEMLPEGESHAMARGSLVVLLGGARDAIFADAARLGQRVAAALEHAGLQVPIGVGSVVAGLDQAATSFAQAVGACRVAARVPGHGPVAVWDRLGAYRALLSIPEPWDPTLLHPGVAAVGSDAEGPEFLETAEVYLDECGKAARAAARLHIHRGTLYYRLRRFSELTGCDLDDGADRLAAHLALKAMHLRD